MSTPSAARAGQPLAHRSTEEFRQWADEVRAATTDRPLGVGGARPAPGGRSALVRLPLDAALRAAVGRAARAHRVTPLTVGLAALAVTLTRRTGTDRAVAGALRVPVVLEVRDEAAPAELLAATDRSLERSISLWADGADGPVPDHLVEFRHGAAPAALSGALEISVALWDTDPANGAAELVARYSEERYSASGVLRLLAQLRTVLRGLTGEQAPAVGTLPLLEEDEQRELLALGQGRALPAEGREPVHERVSALARTEPGRTAVVCGDDRADRGELEAWAGRIAARLAAAGVAPGDRVAVLADRSVAMVAAVLGALRAGAAYVPVDPANPDARIAAVLADAGVAAVLVTGELGQRITEPGLTVVAADEDALREPGEGVVAGKPAGEVLPVVKTRPEDPAYLIYTSGSTGTPKGVVVEHAQLAASTLARREVYPDRPVFLLLSPLAFDSSVAGLWGTLTAGGQLVVAGPDEYRDPEALLGLIERHAVTHLLCVPSLYDAILTAAERLGRLPAGLTTVITAGEALSEDLLRRHAGLLGATALVNEYGPTEATVWASYRRFEAAGPVDIGGPVPGALLYVLDRAGRLVPPGVTGELHIGGAGVSRGYFGQPQATAKSFVPDPFAGGDARMYRTGDLVRWSGTGTLEFLGRRDNQVKIRGHRVELGAVESALRSCPGIRDAVAVADAAGTRLTGFVVTSDPAALDSVRERLARVLPAAAVPARLRAVDAFPVTVNGKADRAALATLPEQEAQAAQEAVLGGVPGEHAAPAPAADGVNVNGVNGVNAVNSGGDTVAQVSAAWAEVLEISSVPTGVNFFDLGGHSLLIMRLQEALGRHTGVRPSVVELFRCSTVDAQAELVRAGGGADAAAAAPADGRAERARRERAARARQRRALQGATR
ncbi:non-ribosomal peptide synthetase [Streptomyces sp. NBC_01006]|uniref:non-ribosomal peptide synthetase n=1 Tax=Streptomyces sp. NBC_01006 TaxID=2903716 RepID=UPI002F908408|nr:non-ribosomal peptide synthetase [Streptomyces sp. NBC_01006]